MLRWIMHVDMDAFFASVEQLDRPELQGLPVIVGGTSSRGVVSTCSYEARRFGVHSAMPIVKAKQLCPQGVFVPGRMWRYKEISNQIMEIFSEISPLVEQLSIDEAFLDMTGTEMLYGGVLAAAKLVKERIKRETGLTGSVGLAPNKFLAKMASDLQKPDGLTVISHEKAREFIAPLPVTKIFGIGKGAAEQLRLFGVTTIGQLAQVELSVLQKVFGKNAQAVQQLAIGIDDRPVVASREAKSIGREHTYERDITSYEECKQALLSLSGEVGYRVRRQDCLGHTLTLKVKYADFTLKTHSYSTDRDISCDEDIYELACELLEKVALGKGIRLLGISLSNLEKGSGFGLAFEEELKLKQRNAAVDDLKKRFGEDIISRGKVKKDK